MAKLGREKVYQDLIQVMATQIRKEMGAMELYNGPVDMDNPDEVIVAAYLLGENKNYQIHLDEANSNRP